MQYLIVDCGELVQHDFAGRKIYATDTRQVVCAVLTTLGRSLLSITHSIAIAKRAFRVYRGMSRFLERTRYLRTTVQSAVVVLIVKVATLCFISKIF